MGMKNVLAVKCGAALAVCVQPGLAAKIAKPVVFYPLCCPPLNIFETVSDIVRQMRYCAFTTRRILMSAWDFVREFRPDSV